MKELGYKLRSLSHSASAASTAEWPHLETGEVGPQQEEATLEGLTKIEVNKILTNFGLIYIQLNYLPYLPSVLTTLARLSLVWRMCVRARLG